MKIKAAAGFGLIEAIKFSLVDAVEVRVICRAR